MMAPARLPGEAPVLYRFAGIEIDEDRDELRREGEPVPAQKKVRDLLLYLLRRRDRLVSKEELFTALWPGVVVNEPALTQAIYGARRAVGDDARRPRVIQTVRGRGVRFVAEVEAVASAPARRAGGADRGAAGPPPFVGREGLLEELGGALRAAQAGDGGVFLMAGEPGIGKTRAAEEFAAVAEARGAAVHVGRCHEAPGAPAFWPWVQLLRSQLQACDEAELAALLGSGAEDVAQIAPELVPDARPREREALADPGPARFRLFDAVTQLWQRAAAERPLVLVLDDLHRADPPSWRLLHFLARELRGSRILVVGTYRDADAHRDPETADLLAELARQPGVRSVQLEGLAPEEVARFLNLFMTSPPSAKAVTTLADRAGGNPYFLIQLALLLTDRRDPELASPDGQWPLPRSLREAIARQLDGLPASTRNVLTVASVSGRTFDAHVIADAIEYENEHLLDTIDAALSERIIFRDPKRLSEFHFSHILVRDALYESLSARDRASLHLRLGIALEKRLVPDSEELLAKLAYHYREASVAAGHYKAIDFLVRAAEAATARLGFEEAAGHYKDALDLLAAEDEAWDQRRCEIRMAHGEALIRAGRREEAKASFTKAADLAIRYNAGEQLARIALRVAPGFFTIETGVHDPFVVSLLETSLRALPSSATALRARVLGRLAMALYWSESAYRRAVLIEQAESYRKVLSERYTEAFVLAAKLVALWSPESFEERMRLAPILMQTAREARDVELELMARVFFITTLIESGAGYTVDREIRIFSHLSSSWSGVQPEWYSRLFAAMNAVRSARLNEAEARAEELLQEGSRLSDANVVHSHAALMAAIRWLQCRAREIVFPVESFSKAYPNVPGWRCALALFAHEAGDSEKAELVLDQIYHEGCLEGSRDMNWLAGATFLGDAAVGLHRRDAATWVYRLLRPFSGRQVVAGFGVVPFGPVDRVLGRLEAFLGYTDSSERSFESAVVQTRRSRSALWTSMTLADWASALVTAGHSTRAAKICEEVERLNHLNEVPLVRAKLLGTQRASSRPSEPSANVPTSNYRYAK